MDSIVIEQLAARKRTLRLSIVTETYPPEVNGVALSLSRFVDGLLQLNHEIQLIRPRQQRDRESVTATGIEEVLTTGLPIPNYPDLKVGLPAKRRLVAQWTRRRPDLVHIVTEGPLGWSALEAARKLRIPVSSDFRTNFHSYSQHYGIGWLKRPIVGYLRKFHNKTSMTTVPTERMRSELSAIGFKNVRVLSRGVNATLYDPARRSEDLRARWGLNADNLLLIHVGRLAAEKNLELLIKAYECLKAQDPKVRLLLVGDGPEKAAMQARVPDAIFAGMQTGEDLASHYASADLFMFTSKTETFGNVTLEAMASGLPVVAFDYAAAAQYVTPQSGCLADLGRDEDFLRGCQAMHAVFVRDPLAFAAMGRHSRLRAERESWPVVVNQFESLLIEATRPI
jgi:glycosyltransferase involved in cell wall biosynthesis